MIANAIELSVAINSLQTFSRALEALRIDLKDANPKLFAAASQSYIERIRSLQDDIFAYMDRRDSETPSMVRETSPTYDTAVSGNSVDNNTVAELPESMRNPSHEILPGAPAWASTPDGAEGVKFGMKVGKSLVILSLLRKRIGQIPHELEARVSLLNSGQLDQLAEQFYEVGSVSELAERLNRI